MGEVLAYSPRHAEKTKTAYVGMVLFIASWAMMFSCFFFIYAAMRLSSDFWPPRGLPMLPLALPGVATAALALSSAALELGIKSLVRGTGRALAPGLLAGTLLGAVFIALQVTVALGLYGEGMTPDRGAYAAVFYGFSGLHAAHVVVGVGALLVLFVLTVRGRITRPRHLSLRLWSIYWHFVGVIWLLMYVLIFVL